VRVLLVFCGFFGCVWFEMDELWLQGAEGSFGKLHCIVESVAYEYQCCFGLTVQVVDERFLHCHCYCP